MLHQTLFIAGITKRYLSYAHRTPVFAVGQSPGDN